MRKQRLRTVVTGSYGYPVRSQYFAYIMRMYIVNRECNYSRMLVGIFRTDNIYVRNFFIFPIAREVSAISRSPIYQIRLFQYNLLPP